MYNGIIILYVYDCVYKSYYNFCLKLDFISKYIIFIDREEIQNVLLIVCVCVFTN